jgi:hypothetical protein
MWKRLGVSTVVANLMMITITMALAAILVAWAGTTYGAFAGGSQLFFVQRGQALQERFVIEYVYFITTTPNTVKVFVRNVGAEQIQIASIYVNGKSFSGSSMGVQSPGPGVCILQNNAVTIPVAAGTSTSVCEFDITTTWPSGSTVYVVAASLRGNQATYTVRGP